MSGLTTLDFGIVTVIVSKFDEGVFDEKSIQYIVPFTSNSSMLQLTHVESSLGRMNSPKIIGAVACVQRSL